ncbi:MAG TPA: hypothetical protein VFP70_09150 [Burkholderiales bacterium]|nr:hypothetical protein [Burkholderiales bacterium]
MRRFGRRAAGLLLAVGLIAAPAPGAAAEQAPQLAERAEVQRLLTQRIARAYCQAGLGVAPAGSGQDLLGSVALFDLQLAKLRQSPLRERERAALVAVEQSWAPLRAATLRRFTREGCDGVSRRSEELLRLTADLARELSGRSGAQAAGTPAAMAARQQVLAQKLARLYMVRAWGLDSVALREEVASARNEFSGALARLQLAPGNAAAVSLRLEEVALQWVWLETALEQEGAADYGLVVADSADAITRGMEAVTRLYQGKPDAASQPLRGLARGGDRPEMGEATLARAP